MEKLVKLKCVPGMGTRGLNLPVVGEVAIVDNEFSVTEEQYHELSKVDMGIKLVLVRGDGIGEKPKTDIGKKSEGEDIKRKSETAEPLKSTPKKEEKEPEKALTEENNESSEEKTEEKDEVKEIDKKAEFEASIKLLSANHLRELITETEAKKQIAYEGNKLKRADMVDWLRKNILD